VGRLFSAVKHLDSLHRAWKKIQKNGRYSLSPQTSDEIQQFGKAEIANLRLLQKQLGHRDFEFGPQFGITIHKTNGKVRPLVLAPLPNRIIQRALLDVLLDHSRPVKRIMATPTSIGGIPKRGTRHAIGLVCDAIDQGARYFIRSDIEGFFTRIPKTNVMDFLSSFSKDRDFLSLFENALNTELLNSEQLGEHKYLFPIGEDGVAQGSSLSMLAGNIVLREFDERLNGNGIVCIRYVDDFILLARNEADARNAFGLALKILSRLGMSAYSPWVRSDKAEEGDLSQRINFLGCTIFANGRLVQPSPAARAHLLHVVNEIISHGIAAMVNASKAEYDPEQKQRFVQTMVRLNGHISSWGSAFRFCNAPQVMHSLDAKLDIEINRFRARTLELFLKSNPQQKRRILGVQLLGDIRSKGFLLPWSPEARNKTRARLAS
jgi:hypothetical protein